jgi:glycosyltransferase involved in cell wall biosynthesis
MVRKPRSIWSRMPARPFVCLVNLSELNPLLNGGVSRIAQEVSRLLIDATSERLAPVFLVRWGFAAQFEQWVGRRAAVVPTFTSADARLTARSLGPNCLVSPLFGMKPLAQLGAPHITQIPDTLALDLPELFTDKDRAGRRKVYNALASARTVVTISQFSRERLEQHTALDASRIEVVHLGADLPTAEHSPRPAGFPTRYVIYPAQFWPHKRHDLLLRVMRQVWNTDPDLRLALPGEWRAEALSALGKWQAELDIAPGQIVFPGFLTDAQLAAAYHHAEAMVFVSAYEGFGMPVLEAMRAGCPVICAPVGALPEIAGDAALYVAGDQPEAWAAALLTTLPARRNALIAAGKAQAATFTWAAFRAGWKQILGDAGVPFIEGGTGPKPPDGSAAIGELERIRVRMGQDWQSDRDGLKSMPQLAAKPNEVWRMWRLRARLVRQAQAFTAAR